MAETEIQVSGSQPLKSCLKKSGNKKNKISFSSDVKKITDHFKAIPYRKGGGYKFVKKEESIESLNDEGQYKQSEEFRGSKIFFPATRSKIVKEVSYDFLRNHKVKDTDLVNCKIYYKGIQKCVEGVPEFIDECGYQTHSKFYISLKPFNIIQKKLNEIADYEKKLLDNQYHIPSEVLLPPNLPKKLETLKLECQKMLKMKPSMFMQFQYFCKGLSSLFQN